MDGILPSGEIISGMERYTVPQRWQIIPSVKNGPTIQALFLREVRYGLEADGQGSL